MTDPTAQQPDATQPPAVETPQVPVPSDTPTPEAPADPLALHRQLLADKAVPVMPDMAWMQQQIIALQAQVEEMRASAPPRTNPIEAVLADLAAHIKARAAQSPSADLSELAGTVDKLTGQFKQDKRLTPDDASLLDAIWQDIQHMSHRYELHYIGDLVRDLRKTVLKSNTGN